MRSIEVDSATLPPAEACQDAAHRTLCVRFTGSGNAYFRIWIVDLLLSIITCSLYRPFARARRLAYFHRHTLLDGQALTFHGDPWPLFVAHLLLIVVVVPCAMSGLFGLASMGWVWLLVALQLPMAWRASLRFRLSHTGWRGLRAAFVGDVPGAYAACLPLFVPGLLLFALAPSVDDNGQMSSDARIWFAVLVLAVSLACVLLGPWLLARLKRYQHGGYALGGHGVELQLGTAALYHELQRAPLEIVQKVGMVAVTIGALIWLMPAPIVVPMVCLLAFVVLPPVAMQWLSTRCQNLLWSHTKSDRLRLNSDLSGSRLAAVLARNRRLMAITLGLYWPFAQVRVAQLRLESISVDIVGDPDLWPAPSRVPDGDALHDAWGAAMSVDMGF
jgi:uncharacterized membrane protein YjgN (DUF898 family)